MNDRKSEYRPSPILLALVSDVLISIPMEAAARKQGLRIQWVENQDSLNAAGIHNPRGQGERWVDFVSRLAPALLLIDMNHQAIPWLEWIRLVKSSPATRDIPVVCFGPHVRADLFAAAREAGADAVLARSRFMSAMGEIMGKYVRREA